MFLVYVMLCLIVLVVTTSAIDCLERLVSKTTYYVSSGTLNLTHSLTHLLLTQHSHSIHNGSEWTKEKKTEKPEKGKPPNNRQSIIQRIQQVLNKKSSDHKRTYKSVVFLAGAARSRTPMSAMYLHGGGID